VAHVGAPMFAAAQDPRAGDDVIGPAIGADDNGMGALVVAAVDQEPTKARSSHFPEGDFPLALHKIPQKAECTYLGIASFR